MGKCMIFGDWGPLEGPLEALLERFDGVIGRPEAIFGVSRASWGRLGNSPLGVSWRNWARARAVPGALGPPSPHMG
eukprot:7728221-Pyramimonas_sp.AAC.1